jgi:hypothetical protein
MAFVQEKRNDLEDEVSSEPRRNVGVQTYEFVMRMSRKTTTSFKGTFGPTKTAAMGRVSSRTTVFQT